MNWSRGYTISKYASLVDVVTWKDIERIEISQGSISRSDDSLIETADIECEYRNELEFNQERWVRVYIDIRQDDGTYHAPLFTGLVSTPSKSIEGTSIRNNLQCYSVLKPVEDVLLPKGWYASKTLDATKILKSLLEVTPAPIYIDSISGQLMENIVAENNETNLSMVYKILNLMNWKITIGGDGIITVKTDDEIVDNSTVLFDSYDNDCLETSISVSYDWFNCPNVFRAIYNNSATAIAKDESLDSPLSIPNRGREVWMEETDCKLGTNESIASYAKRRLREEQAVAYEINYTRRFHPDVNLGSVIRLNYPKQGMVGYFKVESQDINLDSGIKVSEKATKKV